MPSAIVQDEEPEHPHCSSELAQKWFDLANGPHGTSFDAILRAFSGRQMSGG